MAESAPNEQRDGDGLRTSFDHVESGDRKLSDGGLDESNLPRYDDKETKRILRKVDFRLIPMLTLLYVLSFLDRSNIANANVAGMSETLGLSGTQYNLANTVFFFPYAVLEIPSNIVLKLMRPSWWIMIMMVAWGTVVTLQGIVQGYHGLLATRIMLGACESGFFPAATYLVTTWYCRFEVQTRMAAFVSAASLAGAFSGLLAYGIQQMDGVGGLEGWRWIFILEGILTVVVGLTLHWTLPDSPETAKFLTTDEREFLVRRLQQDAGTKSGQVATKDGFKWSSIWSALLEWKVWFAVIIWWGNSIPLYAFTYTAPTIIRDLGYTAEIAQLLTVPVYLLGTISTISFAIWSDKTQTRWKFVCIPYSICAVGFLALICIPHPRLPGLTYAFLFFLPAGLYPGLISLLSWIGNNLAPSWKRAIGLALLIAMGNLGGAIGSNIFLDSQAPNYPLGYGLSFAINVTAIGCAAILRFAYNRLNTKRDRFTEAEVREQYTDEQLLDMGDKSPLYRYVT